MRLVKPKVPRQQWNSPIIDYDVLSNESCKLLFEQSKLYFHETIEESEELTQRSTRMLFLLLPAIAAVVGFCISNQEKFKPFRAFDIFLIIGIAGCLTDCIYHLFKLISPKNMHYRGTKPEEMMRPEIFKLTEPSQVEKALFISEVERYQVKIEQMEFLNFARMKMYAEVVYAFNIMIVLGIIMLIRTI